MTDKIRLALACIALTIGLIFGFLFEDSTAAVTMSIVSVIWFASVGNEK